MNSDAQAETHDDGILGIAVLDPDGRLQSHAGVASQARLRALLLDPAWLGEAAQRRLQIITFTDMRYTAIVSRFEKGTLVVFFGDHGETVLRFFLGVPFAFDIIEHLLLDPFDGMAIIDAHERLVFVSPIHEKFFGLKEGEGVGKKVTDVIENTRLNHVVRTGVAEVGQIQRMRGGERVVSRHPIRHKGTVVGAIGRVMFKGPQQVEALARRINALEQEIETYRSEARKNRQKESCLDAIVGRSPAIMKLRDQIRKIAPLDIPVLIQGESGTGKELVAQALHMLSPRSPERLVTVNAAALPAQLVESELFGYEPGSFTGADQKGRAGKFEQADRGTLFLDEIGDMPLEVQAKLLRVLQDRIVERVGSGNPRKIDFRLCSATNRDLEEFVELGRFRLDLFYRISPVVIHVPALSERLEDIPLLLNHFLSEFATQYDRNVPTVAADVFDYLMAGAWPGNVRQLRHLAERAFVFCEDGRLEVRNFEVTASLPDSGAGRLPEAALQGRMVEEGGLRDALDRYEREIMEEAMLRFNGNKKKVAEYLGVSRTYLYKKMQG
ncbi:sigma-54 interaction domain-containing protein [Castellaniella sp.]|uniref:sigma-54 interaction domain-containing protein n=1 Tax=Castellaniella sp. TaxID=1955812 RepID=UPI003565A89E